MASISSEHILVRKGKELFADSKMGKVHLVEDVSANDFLNDIINFPHAYVLACCMDRQTKAERAWMIPVQIRDILGSFDMPVLAALTADEYKEIFSKHSLHRFNEKMAVVFYDAVQHIQNEYNGDASLIWANNPSSAAVVYRFLQFNGVGIKIATMATNILARQFKVPFSDYYSIDVSPDVHVRRVMYRMGLVKENATNDEIIYKARELCPEFPGIIDYSLWDIGRTYCNAITPKCASCILSDECHKQGIRNKQ